MITWHRIDLLLEADLTDSAEITLPIENKFFRHHTRDSQLVPSNVPSLKALLLTHPLHLHLWLFNHSTLQLSLR